MNFLISINIYFSFPFLHASTRLHYVTPAQHDLRTVSQIYINI